MALVATDMQCANVGTSRLWLYSSPDDIAAANYFDEMAKTLLVGDQIEQNDGANARMFTVLANDGASVTVGPGAV